MKKKIVIGISIVVVVILLGIIFAFGISDSSNNTDQIEENKEKVESTEEGIVESSTETEHDTELVVEVETETEKESEIQTENEVVMNGSETKEEPKVESSQKEESPKEEPPKSEEKDVQYDADGRKIYRVIDGINFYADWEYSSTELAAMDAGFEVLTQDPVSGGYCMLYKHESNGDHYAEDFRASELLEEKLLEIGLVPWGGSGSGGNCGSGNAGVVKYFEPTPLPTDDAKKRFEETGEEMWASVGPYDYKYDGEKWVKIDVPSADEYDDYDDLHSFDGSW